MNTSESRTTIANLALTKLGQNVILTTLDDPNSPEAVAISSVYNSLRDDILAKFMWSFAQKTTTLATLAITVPDFGDGVSIAYGYPSDYIKANFFNIGYALIHLEAGGIYSDTPGLMMKYTYQNDDPTTYTPELIQACATRIAAEICLNITQNATKQKGLFEEALIKLADAISSNSRESGTPLEPQQDEWFIARLAGSNSVVGKPGDQPQGNIGFYIP